MRPASLTGLGAGLLLVSLVSAPPQAAEAEESFGPAVASPSASITERPAPGTNGDTPVEVAAPNPRARSAGYGSIAVGTFTSVTWRDCPYDEELGSYYSVLAITGAEDGAAYTASMGGMGAVQVWVLDADGEAVTYAGHPDGLVSPQLEWQYQTGDFLLVLSGPMAQAGSTASVTLSRYGGDRSIPGAGSAGQLTTDTAGELDPRDRYLPFHGGHYDTVMRLPKGATSGQLVVLEFEGEDTDWLSVAVLTDRGAPVLEYAVDDGWVAFPQRADEVFVVTSLLPDEFGSYAYTWTVLPDAPVAHARDTGQWWDLDRPPFYTVTWTRTALITPTTLVDGPAPATYRVEVSRDGTTWSPANLTGRNVPVGTAEVELWEGEWRVRVALETGGYEIEGDPIAITSWGDRRGWVPTAVTLELPAAAPVPGKADGYRDLRGAIGGTETYRDGRTRPIEDMGKYTVQFRYAGRSDWMGLGHGDDGVGVTIPASGDLRVVAQTPGTSPVAVSNIVPVTVHRTTGAYKGSIATPTRSTSTPGAMVFTGTISGKWTDGSWRPATDGTWYKVQQYSKGKWRTLGSARTTSANPGAINTTFLLDGKGKYRIVAGKSVIKTWTLKPVAPTKTAKVLRPTITAAGAGRYGVSVAISQRFADGRWGPGQHGWTYKAQYRAVGAHKWRGTTTTTMTGPGPFDVHVRTPAVPHEFRVVATYKGRTYTSPTSRP